MYCLAILLAAALSAPASAANRKGDKLAKEGAAAENAKDLDKALALYEQALATEPKDPGYLILVRRARFATGQAHIDAGKKLRSEGKLNEALQEFNKAYIIDPSSTSAEQEIRRTQEMMRRNAERPAGEASSASLTPMQKARKDAEDRAGALQDIPQLRPVSKQISNLKMNNQPVRVLFETVSKLAGINVLFDPDLITQSQGKTYSLDLTNSTIEEALDYLSLLTRAFWKPVSANAIFVTQEQPTKRRDFEDHVSKVFYLQNVSSQQELNEVIGAVRTVVDLRRMMQYTSQMAIIVRDTADKVALAEKLILDLDKPKPEVVIDIMVMEANRTKTRSLAATLANAGKAGINQAIGFSPRATIRTAAETGTGTGTGTTTPSTAVNLSKIGQISTADFSATLPGAVVQALIDDRQTRVLQNPQIRTLDMVKGELKIGDRYPYATGSFQSGLGGVGVGISPLVQTQFQFAEVGVNLSVLPKIHSAEEVSLHVEIELSNIRDQVDVGGLRQPVIGQRKIFEDVRLREGEVSLIGGLSSLSTSRTSTGIPGLATLPGIGWLFGTQGTDRSDSELLVVLVPRIVRAPEISEGNMRGVLAGNEATVKLTSRSAAPAPAATPTPAQSPAVPAPPPPAAPAPSAPAKVQFAPGMAQGRVGAPVIVTIEALNVTDLFSAPFRIDYDKSLLRLVEVTRGPLMGDGGPVSFTRDVASGVVKLNKLPGTPGVTGSGALVTLTFQALAKGTATVKVEDALWQDSKLQPLSAERSPLQITID